MTEAADPFRKHLVPPPRKKIDVEISVANILTGLEELQSILPPDEDDIDDDEEPDSPDLVACKKRVNKLRRELRSLRRPP